MRRTTKQLTDKPAATIWSMPKQYIRDDSPITYIPWGVVLLLVSIMAFYILAADRLLADKSVLWW